MGAINKIGSKCIRLVTFDFTNTLAVFAKTAGEQYASALAIENIQCCPQVLNNAFFKNYKPFLKQYPFYGAVNGMSCEIWWKNLFFMTLETSLENFNLDKYEQVYSKVFSFLYNNFEMNRVNYSTEVLQQLNDMYTPFGDKMCIGIITNNDSRCYDMIKKFNWTSYFDYIYVPALIGKGKPDASVFYDAIKVIESMRQLKYPLLLEQCLHVGNNYKDDYVAAKNAGLNALLVKCTTEDNESKVPKEDFCQDLRCVIRNVKSCNSIIN